MSHEILRCSYSRIPPKQSATLKLGCDTKIAIRERVSGIQAAWTHEVTGTVVYRLPLSPYLPVHLYHQQILGISFHCCHFECLFRCVARLPFWIAEYRVLVLHAISSRDTQLGYHIYYTPGRQTSVGWEVGREIGEKPCSSVRETSVIKLIF